MKPAAIMKPMFDRLAEPDSPHGSDMATAHRRQTDGLYWHCSMNTRSWVWPYGYYAAETPHSPHASISAEDTWTDVEFSYTISYPYSSDNVGLPWRFSESAAGLMIYTRAICGGGVGLQFRWDAEALVDAVGTTTGSEVPGQRAPSNSPEMMYWMFAEAAGGGSWKEGSYGSRIESPAVPANRRIKLTPHVKVSEAYAARFVGGATISVVITSITVMEYGPLNTVGG